MFKLSRVNSLLLAVIIVLNLYVILAPFAADATYVVENHGGVKAKQLNKQIHSPVSTPKVPQQNHVIIPSMLLNKPILEGQDTYAILNRGIWRWPAGSTPDHGGNTVLIGHRFTYTNPQGVFYYLNKVKLGDEIGMYWNNKKYLYKVSSIKVVPPSDVKILNPTVKSELTIYTCTPLWWPKDRLVMVANLETN